MPVKVAPPLRCPTLGAPIPWLDTRQVTRQTLLEYLGIDAGAFHALAAEGVFAGPGCATEVGGIVRYCPAAIWKANHWVPDTEVVATVMAALSISREQDRRKAEILDRAHLHRSAPTV